MYFQSEKRQLAEVKKGLGMLSSSVSQGQISPAVTALLDEMARCFASSNFKGGLAVHVTLTSSHWSEHKAWLKPLKYLIQMGQRKLQR